MSRTTINVPKADHQETADLKDEYGDSWTDVLRFYREHRPAVSVTDDPAPVGERDTLEEIRQQLDDLSGDGGDAPKFGGGQVEALRQELEIVTSLAEQARDNTEEIMGRMR